MDYMDLDVTHPKKAIKLNHSLIHLSHFKLLNMSVSQSIDSPNIVWLSY